MSERASQQDYWNSRAASWGSYDAPLIPSQPDLDFHKNQLVPGGDTLILGATPELCSLALETSASVTAVDFAEDVIKALQRDDVQYECIDWLEFFDQSSDRFTNIMTDGGLLCLEFPRSWEEIADHIHTHLRPNGIFSARVYVSAPDTPPKSYNNPNLERFINSMADVDEDWMLEPQHPDYRDYDVRYALPPESEVLRVFDHYALVDRLVPDYEAGEHFVSYALKPM